MSERITWINYKGHSILLTDWTNLTDEKKFIAAVNETSQFVIDQQKYGLLELIDVTKSQKSTAVLFTMKKMALLTRRFNKKKAIIGINMIERMVLEAVNKFASEKISPFETKEQALEWLIKNE